MFCSSNCGAEWHTSEKECLESGKIEKSWTLSLVYGLRRNCEASVSSSQYILTLEGRRNSWKISFHMFLDWYFATVWIGWQCNAQDVGTCQVWCAQKITWLARVACFNIAQDVLVGFPAEQCLKHHSHPQLDSLGNQCECSKFRWDLHPNPLFT